MVLLIIDYELWKNDAQSYPFCKLLEASSSPKREERSNRSKHIDLMIWINFVFSFLNSSRFLIGLQKINIDN